MNVVSRTVWSNAETIAFLEIWRDEDIEGQMAGIHRNMPIMGRVSELLLSRAGFVRNGAQCRTKMKALKNEYKNIKNLNNRSGRGPSTNQVYELMDEILGHRPITQPRNVVDIAAADYYIVEAEVDCEEEGRVELADLSTSSTSSQTSTTTVAGPSSSADVDEEVPSCSGTITTSVNDFKKKNRKRKADQVSEILKEYIQSQDSAMEKLRKSEMEQLELQLAAEKEMRKEEFEQNMAMMKTMMGIFAGTISSTINQVAQTGKQGIAEPQAQDTDTENLL